jgi:hypothetical protein
MVGIATRFAPSPAAFETAFQAGFRRAELWTDAVILGRWEEVARLAGSYPFDSGRTALARSADGDLTMLLLTSKPFAIYSLEPAE